MAHEVVIRGRRIGHKVRLRDTQPGFDLHLDRDLVASPKLDPTARR
jgi:hypothetical protein